MSNFVSSVNVHGSTAVAPKPHEINALVHLLKDDIIVKQDNQQSTHPQQQLLRQAIVDSLHDKDPEILYKLGTLHQFGLHGLPLDTSASMPYFELGSSFNHLPSMNALASLYADMYDSTKIIEYHQQASKLYQLAYQYGSVDALYNLGCLTAADRNQPDAMEQALKLWHQSATRSHLPSLSALCNYYWAAKDYQQLVPMARKASQLGDEAASILLATCLFDGLGTAKSDPQRAIELLRPVALHGTTKEHVVMAASNLGHMFVASSDFSSATTFYTIASQHGHAPSTDAAARLHRMKAIRKQETNQKLKIFLGARKTTGTRCSHCNHYGYVEKNWIQCMYKC